MSASKVNLGITASFGLVSIFKKMTVGQNSYNLLIKIDSDLWSSPLVSSER